MLRNAQRLIDKSLRYLINGEAPEGIIMEFAYRIHRRSNITMEKSKSIAWRRRSEKILRDIDIELSRYFEI